MYINLYKYKYIYINIYIYIYIYLASNKWDKFLKIDSSKSNFCVSMYRVFIDDFN